tara:strand:+ start:1356 stop:2030 length:675 start_codon:yes stop_codon:yes gene_type:complete
MPQNPLTPLASLCLGVVRGWINVAARGKGGQIDQKGTAWTRLPADQLREQLEREFMVEVSTRSIHRALTELTEANQLRREQRWKHRYKRDYWYSLPAYEEELNAHRPRTISSTYQSQQTRSKVHYEVTAGSVQDLSTPTLNTQVLRRNSQNQKPKPTRKESLSAAVESCYSKGKTNGGVGFGVKTSHKEPKNKGTDHLGRILTEIWVGGRPVMVADEPTTTPIR